MYHISDLKKFLRCERLYFYSMDEANVFRPYLHNDKNINELLIKYFRIDNYYEGIRNDNPARFIDNFNNYEWFIHPRLADGELRINIPLIHKKENNIIDIYYIYYSNSIRELDTLSYRIGLDILNKQGFEVDDIYVICFNPDYRNEGELDVEKLFIVTNELKGKRIIDLSRKNDTDYLEVIQRMENGSIDSSQIKKTRYCKLNGLCDYYDECFPEESDKDIDSILTLVTSQNKVRMYEQGIEHLKDADVSLLEGNRVQYAQIMASRNGGLYIDRLALKKWLDRISERPISFIDFEWDRYLIPEYRGMKPLDVVCFEFALYYIDEEGHMEHRTFIGSGDCRKEFVEALLEYVPDKGPILAYNAIGAEALRLKELAEIYPEYHDDLYRIIDRFVDLAYPFMEGLIYDTRMEGDFTLKKLVDICSEYSYKSLDIYDGMEAVFSWRNIAKSDEDGTREIVDNLREYCSLDAYGLFLVYRWLIKLMIESK